MSCCRLIHLEARLTPIRFQDPSIGQKNVLTSSGDDLRAEGALSIGSSRLSTCEDHKDSEGVLRIKQHHHMFAAIRSQSDNSKPGMTSTRQHSVSAPASFSCAGSSSTSGHKFATPNSKSEREVSTSSPRGLWTPEDGSSSGEPSKPQQDHSALAIKSDRSTAQQQLPPSACGSPPRPRTTRWKCAAHNTVSASYDSPTLAASPVTARNTHTVGSSSSTSTAVSVLQYREVERYANENGKIGVVICPNYGRGWSTFFHRGLEEARHNNNKQAVATIKHTIEVMIFDKAVIKALLEGNRSKAVSIVRTRVGNQIDRIEKIWPLEIRWVDPAEEVFVHEYDGKETLCMKRDLVLWNA